MANHPEPLDPSLAPLACWRLIPANKPQWQPGLITHDPDLDGWMWEDAEPDDAPRGAPHAYWTPPLLDAHTHLGDAFLRPSREHLPRSIQALVAPPDGVKHRELARADPDQVHQAIHERAHAMLRNGTEAALDFREGGTEGLKLLHSATTGTGLGVHVLGRPDADPNDADIWNEQARTLLAGPTLGLGLSGIRDLPPKRLDDAADACRRHGKPLALHLSEARHESVEDAMRYHPRILVHLVHTQNDEWDRLADSRALTVACPTSNRFFGKSSPIDKFHWAFREQGLPTALGTDNAMLSDGDLRDEARLAAELHPTGDLDWLLQSISWTPWRAFDLGPDPDHPGLLWGLDTKTPNTHPEDTPLSKTKALWENKPKVAPRV